MSMQASGFISSAEAELTVLVLNITKGPGSKTIDCIMVRLVVQHIGA